MGSSLQSLISAIPDVELLLALEPEELGLRLLLILRQEPGQQGKFVLHNNIHALVSGYPGERLDSARLAVSEAWAWLESQALLIPAYDQTNSSGWRVLTRRAQAISGMDDFVAARVGALLPKEFLHSAIPAQVWPNFVKGDYDTAAFQAMRQVEIALRSASGLTEESGVKLARRAFHPENGSLTDTHAEGGERHAISDLFAGALGYLKNPHSHRVVGFDLPADAAAVVLLASYLLRLLDSRVREIAILNAGPVAEINHQSGL